MRAMTNTLASPRRRTRAAKSGSSATLTTSPSAARGLSRGGGQRRQTGFGARRVDLRFQGRGGAGVYLRQQRLPGPGRFRRLAVLALGHAHEPGGALVLRFDRQRAFQQRYRFVVQFFLRIGVQARLRRFHQQIGIAGHQLHGFGEGFARFRISFLRGQRFAEQPPAFRLVGIALELFLQAGDGGFQRLRHRARRRGIQRRRRAGHAIQRECGHAQRKQRRPTASVRELRHSGHSTPPSTIRVISTASAAKTAITIPVYRRRRRCRRRACARCAARYPHRPAAVARGRTTAARCRRTLRACTARTRRSAPPGSA